MTSEAELKSAENALRMRADARPWRAELKAFIALGWPMAMTQLVQFSINTVDVLMIGRIGPEALAAASQGLVIYYVAFLVGLGPAMAMTPMVSQALGADGENIREARRSVRMGLWAIATLFPLMCLLFLASDEIIRALGQPEALARGAGPYVLALGPGWPFMLGVVVLRNFLAAIDRTRAPLVIIIVTTVINAGLNYLLIYGAWGLPRLELVGAGIASALSHMIGFFALVAYILWDRSARRFDLFTRLHRPDWERYREVWRLGWPIGLTIAFEAMLFNACIFIMGRIGVAAVAAHQVALNVVALAFMIPLGLSLAGATRVGLAQGAGDAAGVQRAAAVTVAVCVAVNAVFAVVIAAGAAPIAGLYLDAEDPANAEVVALAAALLPIAAAFMLFDAAQVAANQCLRGLKDVDAPMILTGVSYWLIGFPAAVGLGLFTPLEATGVWMGLLLSLAAAAVFLGARLWILVRRGGSAQS